MNNLSQYIVEKLKINKDTVLSPDDLEYDIIDRDDEITNDFRKLYKMIVKEFGENAEPLDSLITMSEFNDDYSEFYYEWNPNKWARFLRDVVNYDWISLKKNGSIDIKNSNHKDIAAIISKWNTLDIGKKVYDSFR